MSEDRPAWYGGNKIPASYIAEFNRRYGIGQKKLHDEMPQWMRREIEKEFGA